MGGRNRSSRKLKGFRRRTKRIKLRIRSFKMRASIRTNTQKGTKTAMVLERRARGTKTQLTLPQTSF